MYFCSTVWFQDLLWCVFVGGGQMAVKGRWQSGPTTRVHYFLPPAHFLALDNAPVSVREQFTENKKDNHVQTQ